MYYRTLRYVGLIAFVAFSQFSHAADTDRAVLNATADLLFATSESEMVTRIADDATFGAQENGSLLKGVAGRAFGEPIAEQIDSITLFDRSEIHTLEKVFPNRMWGHVRKRIGTDRGAFVRFRVADSSSQGSAPAGTPAMVVLVVQAREGGPKVVHLSSDDEE